MAEEKPVVANKKLLVVALILAALTVVIYQTHLHYARKQGRGETIVLLQFTRDVAADQRINRKDLQEIEVSREFAEGLGNYVTAAEMDYALSSTLNQNVLKGRWLLYDYTIPGGENRPSSRISQGMVTHTLVIDPLRSPGEILHIGDRINVMGMFQLDKKPPQAYRIVENLGVLEIGGRSYQDMAKSRSGEGMRQFQKLTVEVTPEMSRQLANLMTHLRGNVWVEVRNPMERVVVPQIHEELRPLASSAEVKQ